MIANHPILGPNYSYHIRGDRSPLRYMVMLMPRILVQVTIYRRLRIGRDGHLDQSEAYDIS